VFFLGKTVEIHVMDPEGNEGGGEGGREGRRGEVKVHGNRQAG
jgi:hypothetical protein